MHSNCSAGSRRSVCYLGCECVQLRAAEHCSSNSKGRDASLPMQCWVTNSSHQPAFNTPSNRVCSDCDSSAPPTPRTGAAKWGTADGGRKTADPLLPSESSWAARHRSRAPNSAMSAATRGLWHSCPSSTRAVCAFLLTPFPAQTFRALL